MKWISVKKRVPTTPVEVLCRDALGNYFIGYYHSGRSITDGNRRNEWMVSMYDEPDKSNEDNPDVTHWCEIKPPKRGFFSRILHLTRKIKK